jgi:hypothetical protein
MIPTITDNGVFFVGVGVSLRVRFGRIVTVGSGVGIVVMTVVVGVATGVDECISGFRV